MLFSFQNISHKISEWNTDYQVPVLRIASFEQWSRLLPHMGLIESSSRGDEVNRRIPTNGRL